MLGRWTTHDPEGFIDSSNLYQYALNNPYQFYDPYGENLGGFILGIAEMVAGGALILTGGALEVATLGGFTICLGVTTTTGAALISHGAYQTAQHSQDLSYKHFKTLMYPMLDVVRYGIDSCLSKRESKETAPIDWNDDWWNPTKPPEEGFEWKGNDKTKPGRSPGNWIRGKRPYETLNPDLDHESHGPHWDYVGPKTGFKPTRIYSDGTWEIKK